MSLHANIAVFVPHLGCPNRCSFCDQHAISGSVNIPNAEDVRAAVKTAMQSSRYSPENTEIAFFGGSFTAIDRTLMDELLNAAYEFVKNGDVRGIRISTRPDAIDTNILQHLKDKGVTAIELGAQCMNDEVLIANKRGHMVEDVRRSAELIKAFGFSLGLQMMTGLYKSSAKIDFQTAEQFAELSPDTVRIYPTIVFENTALSKLYKTGSYAPEELKVAVENCAKLLQFFAERDIAVIRLGLHSLDADKYIAGPWHPAFSELVYSKIYLEKAVDLLRNQPAGNYIIYVKKGNVSKMTGNRKSNIIYLKSVGYNCAVREQSGLDDFEIKAERSDG